MRYEANAVKIRLDSSMANGAKVRQDSSGANSLERDVYIQETQNMAPSTHMQQRESVVGIRIESVQQNGLFHAKSNAHHDLNVPPLFYF